MNLDSTILLWINGHYTEWLDQVMWTVSQARTWIPLYVVLTGLLAYKYRDWKAVLMMVIGIGVAVGLSDYIASSVIKPLVCRVRPTHEPELAGMVRMVNDYAGGLYGFCSSHAANTMSVALVFSLLFRNKIATIGMMTWVALNCYSRMYLGVHYPGDIIAGLLLGALMGWLVFEVLAYLLHAVGVVVPRDDS